MKSLFLTIFLLLSMLNILAVEGDGTCDYEAKYIDKEDCVKTCQCSGSHCAVNRKLTSVKNYICQKESDLATNEGDCEFSRRFDSEADCKANCFCNYGYCNKATLPNPDPRVGQDNSPLTYYDCSSLCGIDTGRKGGSTLEECQKFCKCTYATYCKNSGSIFKCLSCSEAQRGNKPTMEACELTCDKACGSCKTGKHFSPSQGKDITDYRLGYSDTMLKDSSRMVAGSGYVKDYRCVTN